MRIFCLVFIATAWFAIATTGPSFAQETLRIERLQIDLRPEYDRPDMLVIFRGTLANDVPLPATLTLRLPARVEAPHAVAYDDGTDNLLQADYSTRRTADWLLVTLETPSPGFQLEFYDSLTQTGERRSYSFIWLGDYTVEHLDLFLLPPPGPREIQTDLALSPVQQGQATGFRGTLGSLAAGHTLKVTTSYDDTTINVVQVVTPPDGEDSDNTPLLAGAIIIIAVVLAIGGTVWYTRRARPQRAAVSPDLQQRTRRKGRAARKRPAQTKPTASGYCTRCGRPLRADDRFCGKCGTPVKGEAGI